MNNTTELNYYVDKRNGFFNGNLTHVVKIRDKGNCILCFGPEHCCELVAEAMNMIDRLGERYGYDQ